MGAGAGSDAAAPAAGPKAKGAGGDERAGGAQKGGNVSRPMPTPTCRIFVSNPPYTLDRKAALQAVADAGAAKGLASFTMRASNRRRKASRKARARTNQGFCLARYESEEDAARAYKAMRASGVAGRRPQLKFVTEAQAANDVHGEEGADGAGGEGAKKKAKSAKAGPPPAASEGRSVHLSGLADDITEAELWNAFNRKKLHSVKLPPPREGAAGGRVAFVHCLSQAFAARIVREAQEGSAPEGLRGVEGGEVAVSLAMSKKARVAAEAKRVAEAKAAEERKIKAEARAKARAEREAAKAAEAAAAAARADEEGAAMDEGEDGGGSESSSDSDSDSGSSSDSDSGSSSDSDSGSSSDSDSGSSSDSDGG